MVLAWTHIHPLRLHVQNNSTIKKTNWTVCVCARCEYFTVHVSMCFFVVEGKYVCVFVCAFRYENVCVDVCDR